VIGWTQCQVNDWQAISFSFAFLVNSSKLLGKLLFTKNKLDREKLNIEIFLELTWVTTQTHDEPALPLVLDSNTDYSNQSTLASSEVIYTPLNVTR
jgi:hypothetical protein